MDEGEPFQLLRQYRVYTKMTKKNHTLPNWFLYCEFIVMCELTSFRNLVSEGESHYLNV